MTSRSFRSLLPRPGPRSHAIAPSALAAVAAAALLSAISACSRADAAQATPAPPAHAQGPRFTLRLGQGFRFHDGVVVVNPNDAPDLVFKYVPPQIGGMTLRYNPISQQVENGMEPTLTSPVPLLLSAHLRAFDTKPNVAHTTSGDIATYDHQAPVATGTRYVLLMTQSGEQYLLTLDELEAPLGHYDDWRIGFAYQAVQLPVGLTGGQIQDPLPGQLVYRDWYRTKMIMRLDLQSGREQAIADGILPTALADATLAYGDSSNAYVVRGGDGAIRSSTRFDEQIVGPQLSPDGTRVVASVYRPGPEVDLGNVKIPGAAVLSVAVFDLHGVELVAFQGYDDAVWTPDAKVIATGPLNADGLFELDPQTNSVRTIAAQVGTPQAPCVSPDGRVVAFVTGGRIWRIGRDGTDLRQVLPDSHVQQRPVFSPDGTKLAAVVCDQPATDMTGEVFVIDLATQAVTPLRTCTGAALVPDTTTRLYWLP